MVWEFDELCESAHMTEGWQGKSDHNDKRDETTSEHIALNYCNMHV